MARIRLNVLVHQEDGRYWAEVEQLPGCFASGDDVDELKDALIEAIQMWLPEGIELGEEVCFEQLREGQALVTA